MCHLIYSAGWPCFFIATPPQSDFQKENMEASLFLEIIKHEHDVKNCAESLCFFKLRTFLNMFGEHGCACSDIINNTITGNDNKATTRQTTNKKSEAVD